MKPATTATWAPTCRRSTEDQRATLGVALPRDGVRRLTQGRGQYIDDIELPRLAHVVFWRSPGAQHAHRPHRAGTRGAGACRA